MAGTSRIDLLSNAAAGNGSGMFVQGGRYAFFAAATFGGGNVKLQVQDPEQNWSDVSGTTITANSMVLGLDLPPGQYRAVATGGGLSAAYAHLVTSPSITTR